MTRLIDADALKTIKSIQSADFNSVEAIRQWIDSAPTIDTTIDIVRCKDCKYWHSNTEFCDQFSHKSAGIAQRMPSDDFCSYGERRE